jgi:murein DD-endopeptidase MepM/ murein hydrolase activator NlpD
MDINDNAQTMINKRDLAIQVQLEKISRNAMKDIPYKGPLKIKTNVTKEMVEKYQRDLQNTFYTDEMGNKKRYYMPASVDVTLEAPDPAELQNVLSEIDIEAIGDEQRTHLQNIQQIEATLQRINDAEIPLNLEPDSAPNMSYRDRANARKRNEVKRDLYNERVADRESDIARFMGYLENEKGQYESNRNYINENETKKSENQAYLSGIDKSNNAQLKIQADEVNRLNRGRLVLEQQPNESPDEFRTRMLETGQATFDETFIEQQAELRVYKDLKTKMKDIVRDEIFIDEFLKTITVDQDYDDAYKYDKSWNAISRAFREFYGTWNENIKVDELRDFFDNVIQRGQTQGITRPEPKEIKVNPYKLTAKELKPKYETEYKEWFSRNRQPGTKPWHLVSNQGKVKILEDLKFAGLIGDEADYDQAIRMPSRGRQPQITEAFSRRTGSGMLPKEAMVGRVKINPYALYYENTLVLLHENGHHYQGFRNTKVSDAFVNIIMKLMNEEDVTSKDVADLEIGEKPLFDHFLYLSGYHKKIGNGLKQTRDQMKERFQLLEGERDAGNTNPMIMEELINLLYKMSQHKMISRSDAIKHIKSYK